MPYQRRSSGGNGELSLISLSGLLYTVVNQDVTVLTLDLADASETLLSLQIGKAAASTVVTGTMLPVSGQPTKLQLDNLGGTLDFTGVTFDNSQLILSGATDTSISIPDEIGLLLGYAAITSLTLQVGLPGFIILTNGALEDIIFVDDSNSFKFLSIYPNSVDVTFNNQALTEDSVVALLAYCALHIADASASFTLNIAGGTNAPPPQDSPATSAYLDVTCPNAATILIAAPSTGYLIIMPGNVGFWANVDATNTAPSDPGGGLFEVALDSSDATTVTATKYAAVINAHGFTAPDPGGTGDIISVTRNATGSTSSPSQDASLFTFANYTNGKAIGNLSVEAIVAAGGTVTHN